MKIEQIYTGCLAQGAYWIYDNGEAAVIDPLREVSPYIERAKKEGVRIKYIFETHFHADFVSGHVTLAQKTGATIVYGPNAAPSFTAYIAKDNEDFLVGKLTFRVLHTPGHTMESTTYLLLDENGNEQAIFTGDTLFIGGVGRPDLAQTSGGLTTKDLASYAYDSLRNKIMPLPDGVLVYPAHGAGSDCGKNMMKETVDTLGNQKKINYALRENMTKEAFVREVTEGIPPPPAYFPFNVQMNKEGYEDIGKIISHGLNALDPRAFEKLANTTKAVMLDVRKPQEFAAAHIPNSIFIGLDGRFAPWVGELLVDLKQPILLIAPKGREEEAITRLSRVGFDNTLGYLKGGMAAWKAEEKKVASVTSVPASSLESTYPTSKEIIFDVRKKTEHVTGHIHGAHCTPLNEINLHLTTFPKDKAFYVHCAGGYRSMIACSILKSKGIHHSIDIQGGFKAIREANIPTTA